MEALQFGKTSLRVTRMGLGLAALGRPGYINLGHGDDLAHDYDLTAMESRAHRVLDAAWDAGLRYIDSARSYGRAEAFLASWLDKRGHNDAVVGSKWGYTYTADWKIQAEVHEVKEHSLSVLDRQSNESRALLGDHLKLYQIHSATLESGVLENPKVLSRLAELKTNGWLIGLSVSGPEQAKVIRKAIATSVDGRPLFDSCQATWNLLEVSASDALEEAQERGLGILVKEGLANGRLTHRNASPAFGEKRKRLEVIATRHQTTLDALALGAVLAQPWAGIVLSGAAQPEHLLTNLTALELSLSSEDLKELRTLAEAPDAYWQTRGTLSWN